MAQPQQRRSDSAPYTKFRLDRIFKNGGQWYFATREGKDQGPFDLREDAEQRLARYVAVMASGFIATDSPLDILPHEP